MCGIAGVLTPGSVGDREMEVVARMNARLFHRGPDSDGVFRSSHAVLAMRRLSIIDLAGGRQPLFNEDGSIAIVCNGEIYNHRELRAELEALGHHFSSHSDVETIVHAYEAFGIDCLKRLRGMFAFALWDASQNRLILARDRLGEKPLYLHRDGEGRVWFSSEMQSLGVAVEGRRTLTAEAFNFFLTFQYLPEPLTPCPTIEILPAGHYLELTPNATNPVPRSYWDLAHASEDPSRPIELTEQVLDNACRLMGTADVPVAVALSGGIDSSLVAAITARHFPGALRAFTIGYKGRPATDERDFARVLADQLGIDFTEVELDGAEVIDGFPDLVAAMDTPVGDIAAFGYFAVCRAAREAGYPVLLSGMGGDEFFWGYEWVRDAVSRNEAARVRAAGGGPWWKRVFGGAGRYTPDFFAVHPDLRNGDAWSRALLRPAHGQALEPDLWLRKTALDPVEPLPLAVTRMLGRTWLRSNCLALVDRMSMAHSVEVRLPLLDVELVDRVTGMRNNGLDDWRRPHKWLLVEALKDVLPPETLSRRKQGFTPPVHDWMNGIVGTYGRLLDDGFLAGIGLVDPGRFHSGGFDLGFRYKLTLLECWARIHLDGQSPAGLRTRNRS